MESDSWTRFAAAVASKRHQHAQQSRHDMYLGFDEIDGGDDEASRSEYACPFCAEDFDIVGLCCHIDEEHPIEARTGVLNSLIGSYMQRRRRLRKDSSGSHSTISLLRKELREGNLQALLGGSSFSIPSAAPDPFLSSLIYTLPASDSLRDSQPGQLDGGKLTSKCSDEKVAERSSSIEPSLSDKDQKERAQRSEFRFFAEHEEEEGGSLVPGSKRPKMWINATRELMGVQCMQRHVSVIEPFLRKVVQEEVHKAIQRFIPSSTRRPINRIQGGFARSYRLLFRSKLPQTLFTGSKIEAEGKRPVEIAIVDAISNKIITSGPLSSMKIDILVINGDFGVDGQEEWTDEEFADSIVRERDGKRPLLTGELVINLNEGIGSLGEATFTDNSSWIRSRKFRLGAKVSQSRCFEGRVQEAISEAFLVKDHRGELYKKHHPPSLDDEVWRLEKIGKDGAFCKRLTEYGIKTVQDFLRFLEMDQDELRTLLGNGMSNKIWEAVIEHARECVEDGKSYSYRNEQDVIIFNSVFRLTGAIINQIYLPVDCLNTSQKAIVKNLKLLACKNPSKIVEFDGPSLPESFSVGINPIQCRGLLGPSNPDIPLMQQGFLHPTAIYNSLEVPSQMNDFLMAQHHLAALQTNDFILNDFIESPNMMNNHSISCNSRENVLGASSTSMLCDDGNGFIQVNTSRGLDYFPHLDNVSPRISSGKWNKQMPKLVAALRWMSIRKCLPTRRSRLVPLDHSALQQSIFSDVNELRWPDSEEHFC
ncbi:hypothetical protein J5N97_015365 [Dioscorea zingiberensis]|uniref:Uncharacterized protein n=1 Tax=Dioscorea zingiberensis TaxID=325984 RepID=A0A9D5HKL1_9LILI|nr:hypothetical protein J5N97_015365 [Dioscorea zingiberensis]